MKHQREPRRESNRVFIGAKRPNQVLNHCFYEIPCWTRKKQNKNTLLRNYISRNNKPVMKHQREPRRESNRVFIGAKRPNQVLNHCFYEIPCWTRKKQNKNTLLRNYISRNNKPVMKHQREPRRESNRLFIGAKRPNQVL